MDAPIASRAAAFRLAACYVITICALAVPLERSLNQTEGITKPPDVPTARKIVGPGAVTADLHMNFGGRNVGKPRVSCISILR